MTNNQNKLIAVLMAAKETEDYNTRNRGVAFFGHWHRTAKSLQAVPVICIEILGHVLNMPEDDISGKFIVLYLMAKP